MKTLLPIALLAATALAGCANHTAFPSLAQRPIEKTALTPPRDDTPPPLVTDPALEAQVVTLAGQVDSADHDWTAALAAARPLVARAKGDAIGGEAWVLAQQAIGRLDTQRAAMTHVVDLLDRLRFAQAESAKPADTGRLDALWRRAAALVDAERASYTALATAIPAS